MAIRMGKSAPRPVQGAAQRRAAWRAGCALAASLLLAGSVQAQIYKWVDAKGKTHYSNNKDDASRAKVEEMKVTAAASPAPAQPPAPQPQPKFELPVQPTGAGPARPPRSVSHGREDGTDASRCALARDVLNGSLHHRNGKPIDQYDRDVANSDVKLFCR